MSKKKGILHLFGHFTFIHFISKIPNMVELYFRITKEAVALLIFHFHFVVVCYMLTTAFPFSETGKIYLFSLKGEMCLVIIFYFLFIYIKGQVTITGNLEKWENWVIRHIYCHKIKEMLLR